MNNPKEFSAKEPSLGYYYQIIYGLKVMLDIKDENYCLRLENLDDIELLVDGNTVLYQTKYHTNDSNITDASPDFWKTIRVWSVAIQSGQIDLNTTIFNLITTSTVASNSILSNLLYNAQSRNIDDILNKLLSVIQTTSNKVNETAFETFKALNKDQQKKLIEKINIIDNSCTVDNALEEIKKNLSVAAKYKNINDFSERLQGWWWKRCIEILQNQRDSISYAEVHLQIDNIRDEYSLDNLPDDFLGITISEEDITGHQNKTFVKQLDLIAQQSGVVKKAIQDFVKAYRQRSEWIRKDLLNANELETFDNKIFDYWENIFVAMKDDCQGHDAEQLKKIGANFYRQYFVNNTAPIKIRERFTSGYLTRGSCHILADDKKIGWHPNFDELLDL